MLILKAAKAHIRAENERLILEAGERIFAQHGFRGSTMQMIADQAGLPKANLHYYFDSKEKLYRCVVEKIFEIWLQAASSFENSDEPKEALKLYIYEKMQISRRHPYGSKVWANEVMQGAPIIQDFLETQLRSWTDGRIERDPTRTDGRAERKTEGQAHGGAGTQKDAETDAQMDGANR